MAKFNGKFLSGVIGGLVFKKVGNKQIVTTKRAAGSTKFTLGSIKAANTFGMASKLGSHIFNEFSDEIIGFHDGTMFQRLTRELNLVLNLCRDFKTMEYSYDAGSFDRLNGLDFNIESPVRDSFKRYPEINLTGQSLQVSLPEFAVKKFLSFPAHSSVCEFTVAITLFRLKDGMKMQTTESQSVVVERSTLISKKHNFEFIIPDGCLCVVGLFLKFFVSGTSFPMLINTKKFSPGGICKAFSTPGIFVKNDKRFWVAMHDLKFA